MHELRGELQTPRVNMQMSADLVGWLLGWLGGGWLDGWMILLLVSWLAVWLGFYLVSDVIGWLDGWLFSCFIVWLVGGRPLIVKYLVYPPFYGLVLQKSEASNSPTKSSSLSLS